MPALLASRQREIRSKGHQLTLRRMLPNAPPAEVMVQAYLRPFQPGELNQGLQQGDIRIEILHDEIESAVWPWPVKKGDLVIETLEGLYATTTLKYAVLGATIIRDAALIIGHSIWARGG